MSHTVQILIIEDDPYARDIMSMLLIRDWRTEVVGAFATLEAAESTLTNQQLQIDYVLIDVEHPTEPQWAITLIQRIRSLRPTIRIILTGTHPSQQSLEHALASHCRGYILNSEILYALPWVFEYAEANKWVMSKSIKNLATQNASRLPENTIVLDGTGVYDHLRPRERDVARLAILYNLRRADIADELGISEGQVNKYVSTVYKIVGLTDILEGLDDPANHFSDAIILKRFTDAQQKSGNGKRGGAREKATLAFHLLTIPVVLPS